MLAKPIVVEGRAQLQFANGLIIDVVETDQGFRLYAVQVVGKRKDISPILAIIPQSSNVVEVRTVKAGK